MTLLLATHHVHSPDLNIIGPLWWQLKKKCSNVNPELFKSFVITPNRNGKDPQWENLDSMLHGIEVIIRAKGSKINYIRFIGFVIKITFYPPQSWKDPLYSITKMH